MNINIDKNYETYTTNTFSNLYVDNSNSLLLETSIYYFPIIICINNGTKEMTDRNKKFCNEFLESKYIPI